jgi:hypothetical protein
MVASRQLLLLTPHSSSKTTQRTHKGKRGELNGLIVSRPSHMLHLQHVHPLDPEATLLLSPETAPEPALPLNPEDMWVVYTTVLNSFM